MTPDDVTFERVPRQRLPPVASRTATVSGDMATELQRAWRDAATGATERYDPENHAASRDGPVQYVMNTAAVDMLAIIKMIVLLSCSSISTRAPSITFRQSGHLTTWWMCQLWCNTKYHLSRLSSRSDMGDVYRLNTIWSTRALATAPALLRETSSRCF